MRSAAKAPELAQVARAARKAALSHGELVRAVTEASAAGHSLRAIAAEAGVSYETVRRMLGASLST